MRDVSTSRSMSQSATPAPDLRRRVETCVDRAVPDRSKHCACASTAYIVMIIALAAPWRSASTQEKIIRRLDSGEAGDAAARSTGVI
jgi:hypothetical protein